MLTTAVTAVARHVMLQQSVLVWSKYYQSMVVGHSHLRHVPLMYINASL